MVDQPRHPRDILNPGPASSLTVRHRSEQDPKDIFKELARSSSRDSHDVVRACFIGRTSDDELQDPTLSLPRQLKSCNKALDRVPENVAIVAYFYDVESGRKDDQQRGHGTAHEHFEIPIRRDGGIADMLAEAASPDRRFDIVICESIDRIWRRTVFSTRIEHELQRLGIPLLAADEPIDLSRGATPRATNILTRRVKQGVAEWYVLEMLEKSRGGYEQHTEAGFNIGTPPYGYLAHKVAHPVPARRAEGRHKTRLALDPVKAPVVEQIFTWRVALKLGYRAIAERLNADPDLYPTPVPPDPSRALGAWSASSVRDILHNPKYTGYMVWNRRATKDPLRKGKPNPPSEWIWSPEPTHPAIVDLNTFMAAMRIASTRARSRSDTQPGTANPHRQTTHVYRLRSYVHCALCNGKRMHGKTRKDYTYYYCQPRPTRPEGHPPTIWVPEPDLLDTATEFFNNHIFGPHRRQLLTAAITADDVEQARIHRDKIDALRRTIADLETRQDRLLRTFEERDDPTGIVFDRLRERLSILATDHSNKLTELRELEKTVPHQPTEAASLLDQLPQTPLDLAEMPTPLLRQLLDAFSLQITYDKNTHHAQFRVEIASHNIPHVHHMAHAAKNPRPGAPPGQFCDEPRRGHHDSPAFPQVEG